MHCWEEKCSASQCICTQNPAPLQSTDRASRGAPTRSSHTHRFAVQVRAQGNLQTFPKQTNTSTGRNIKMHLLALSAPRPEPDPPLLLHPAQSSFLSVGTTSNKNNFQNTVCSEKKHSSLFLRATEHREPQHEDSLQLKQAQSTPALGCQPPAGPPLGSRPRLPFRKARGGRGFVSSSRARSCPTGLLSCPTLLLFPCNPP